VIQFPLELDETKDRAGQTLSHANRSPALNRKSTGPAPRGTASADLIHIVAVGKLAEVKPDLQSGQHLLVIGQLHQRSWKTPEGKNRTRTEVIAMDLRTIDELSTDAWSSTGEMDP
jgi:single-stranded DNA-binding protein